MINKIIALYQKLSKRERTILHVVFVAIGILVMDRIVIGPVFQKMSSLDRQIRDEETTIKKSLHVLLRKQQISNENRQFVIFSVDSKNPEREMTILLKEIENIANRSSVSLLYEKPGNTKEDGAIKKYFATLECEAQMSDVASFFHNIENSTKLLQVEKYSIQPKSKESSIAKCSVTVSRTILS